MFARGALNPARKGLHFRQCHPPALRRMLPSIRNTMTAPATRLWPFASRLLRLLRVED
jgi:hypothetical protein